jgi:hypothetical protein
LADEVRELEKKMTDIFLAKPASSSYIRYAELEETFPIILSYRTEIKNEVLRRELV